MLYIGKRRISPQQKIDFSPKQIAECYMVFGGTPYYLNLLDRSKTLNANIDALYFDKQGELRSEFGFLFRSLFNDATIYLRIVKILSEHPEGLSLNEIAQKLETSKGGSLSSVLQNLCDCDFLSEYRAFGKKQRDTTYKLIDFYSLFYLKFVEVAALSNWTSSSDDPICRSWYASAFELLCYCHIDIIKKALGISGVATSVSTWRYFSSVVFSAHCAGVTPTNFLNVRCSTVRSENPQCSATASALHSR